MVKYARYTVTSGLPGLYMPDVVYTASSKAQAKAIAAEIIENIREDYHEDETLSVWKDADGGASISGEGFSCSVEIHDVRGMEIPLEGDE